MQYPGFDHVGFRTQASRGGPTFWPAPGGVVTAMNPRRTNRGACPEWVGDGICVALTCRGAASGGHSLASGVLLVGWQAADELGYTADKVRVRAATVLALITLTDFLTYANLRCANLTDANLRGANLRGASLTSANLRGADLTGANLPDADLRTANLHGANLRHANLRGADLTGANLTDADLTGANLRGANLRYALGL